VPGHGQVTDDHPRDPDRHTQSRRDLRDRLRPLAKPDDRALLELQCSGQGGRLCLYQRLDPQVAMACHHNQ
jgi:hypothetical protein